MRNVLLNCSLKIKKYPYMTSLYVKLIVRAIMNFPGSHGYSIIKNVLALPIIDLTIIV